MTRRFCCLIAAITVSLLIVACSGKSQDPIVGTWVGKDSRPGTQAVTYVARIEADGTFRLSSSDANGKRLLDDAPGSWTFDESTRMYLMGREGWGLALEYEVVGDELRNVGGQDATVFHRRPWPLTLF